jgi:CheY-like chemotaxis protein
VDDVADSVESLAEMLALWGHEVRKAFTGPEALQEARSFRPDLVLLDIGMPGMDGFEVARLLRQDQGGEKIVLVALTGYAQDHDRGKSQEAGFDNHLVKPVDVDALRNLLARSSA